MSSNGGKRQVAIACFLICLLLDGTMAKNIQGEAYNKTLTIGFTIPWRQGWVVGPNIGSAIVLGIREVRRRGILPGFDIEFVFRDSYCKARRGMQMAVDMWSAVEDLDVIIGDGCSTGKSKTFMSNISLSTSLYGLNIIRSSYIKMWTMHSKIKQTRWK